MNINFSQHKVLIVDDNAFNRQLLAALMESIGIKALDFAENGVQGLEKLAAFQPDLILLDIMMPEMDGFEMCRRLRAMPEHADLPVLINTALGAPEERAACFAAGATDMVSKPINGQEVIARVKIHLERQDLIRDLKLYRERVEYELSAAKTMQLALLPDQEKLDKIAAKHNFILDSHFETSSELGGDFWGVFDLSPTKMGVFLTDFSGHGVTAAINAFRLHTLISHLPPNDLEPGTWLKQINIELKQLLPPGQFATMIYGILDRERNVFTYAAAGATSPILCQNGKFEPQDASGIFIGFFDGAEYENREITLNPGDGIFLYSDALSECVGYNGLALDDDGVIEELASACEKSKVNPLPFLIERFYQLTPRPLNDDLTAVWFFRCNNE